MITRTLVFLLAAGAATNAYAAKIYKCKNDKGEIYYSQTFDRVRCSGGGAEMNEQGLTVKTIERQRTPEEIAADKERAAAEAEAKRQADAQRQADQVLLLSYASEDDLKRAHEQQQQVIDQAIFAARMSVQNQEKSLAELLGSAAEAERAGNPVPDTVTKNIAMVRRQIEEQNAFILKKEGEKKGAAVDFDAKLARYRALIEKQMEGH